MNAIPPAGHTLQDEIEGAIVTLEHLAVQAAHAQEPCAQILFRTAELLRVTISVGK
ncbi:hypothetical protein [Roseomonas haemaphysalidis]|jgi:hypothetical protein|uniref:Uncharacterized protein n=1 Tax=Roseomonas haemaphysalidis TaxID=2768162 RepID=A0ABS3KWD7_9PROT|nr:hypothetical protein [Roseomonas haemaphysalidis]MBO1081788.1 hypothetical protein [Roseomonas haemaphysalidis]